MASRYFTFKGTLKWVKNRTPDEMYQRYTVDLFPDADSLEEFKKSGLQLQIRDSEEGQYIRFARPVSKVIKDDLVKFGPPKTSLADGTEIEELIGNGSKGRVNVVVYDTRKGVGHRWERLWVDELIPYERREEGASTTDVVASQETSKEETKSSKKRPF